MMATEKLSGAMDDEVDAEFSWRLINWRRDRAVAQRDDVPRVGQFGHPFKIGQREQGVRRRFNDDQLRGASDCVGEGVRHRLIDPTLTQWWPFTAQDRWN